MQSDTLLSRSHSLARSLAHAPSPHPVAMPPRARVHHSASHLRSLYQTLSARLPHSVLRQLRMEEDLASPSGAARFAARMRRQGGESGAAPPLHRPSMASLQARVDSFACWPHNDASARGHPYAQPFILALEGFYAPAAQGGQSGGSSGPEAASPGSAEDSVVCYGCGCTLFGWFGDMRTALHLHKWPSICTAGFLVICLLLTVCIAPCPLLFAPSPQGPIRRAEQ